MLVRGGFILLLNRRDLGPQAFEFSIELGLAGQQLGEPGIFFCELGFKLLKLSQSLRWDGRSSWQERWVKRQSVRRLVVFAICPRQPEADVKQLSHRDHRIGLRQRFGTVRRQIAQVFNQFGFDEDLLANRSFKTRFVNEGA